MGNPMSRFVCSTDLTRTFLVAVCVSLVWVAASRGDAPKNQTLQVTEMGEDFEVSVPVSQLVMTIPKNGLSQARNSAGGATDNPRYFYFANKADKAGYLILSGWFESAQRFSGIKKLWEEDLAAWRKKALPEPVGVVFEKIGNWDAVVYDTKIPTGTNSHVRAHWIEAGTWIDIHMSLTSDIPSNEARTSLVERLKTIQVRVKK